MGSPATRPWTASRYSLPASVVAGLFERARRGARPAQSGPSNPARRRFETSSMSPKHADHGRRVDWSARGLVVEADVAAHDGRFERFAGRGDAADGLFERVVDLELLRVAEVQAVGDGDRRGAGADDVAGGLGDRDGRRRRTGRGRRRRALQSVVSGDAPVRPGRRGGRPHRRPGGTTVLFSTWWSYWRKTPRLLAMFGRARRSQEAGVGPRGVEVTAGWPRSNAFSASSAGRADAFAAVLAAGRWRSRRARARLLRPCRGSRRRGRR